MKVIVTGANGQLGSDICEILSKQNELIPFTHDDIDLSDEIMVIEKVRKINPDVVINTAAFHHVEQCELNPLKAYSVNAVGASNLAKACLPNNSRLIHISTDYVYDGNKQSPYSESDQAFPLNTYGISKLAGELMIRNSGVRFVVVRTSGLYGLHPCRAKGGKNFVELMLSLAQQGKPLRVVDTEYVSPTSTLNLARQINSLLGIDAAGICHATSHGSCSWYEFASEIFRIEGIHADLSKANPNEFPAKVKRPTYSVLENNFLKQHGIDVMSHWNIALKEYLDLRRKAMVTTQ